MSVENLGAEAPLSPEVNALLKQLKPEQVVPSEDEVLQITQATRKAMLAEELKNGVPSGKGIYRAIALLDSMDQTALATKKLQSEDANADADRKAAMLITQMAGKLGNTDLFKRTDGAGVKDITQQAQELAKELPNTDSVSGELAQGVSSQTYDEFVAVNPLMAQDD